METYKRINKPSKNDQELAIESHKHLVNAIEKLKSEGQNIEIEETQESIKIPLVALKFLGVMLKLMSEGKPFSLIPFATEVTTQKAAEILGCSRPHLVKLLDEEKIAYRKIGKHRRVKFEDVISYKSAQKKFQKKSIIDIMKMDEDLGLYDS